VVLSRICGATECEGCAAPRAEDRGRGQSQSQSQSQESSRSSRVGGGMKLYRTDSFH
jgi:hypothetical protein